MDLCTQLLKNDSHFNEEYGAFQRYVNEFAGKYRIDNHFNFIIRNDATHRVNTSVLHKTFRTLLTKIKLNYRSQKLQRKLV